MREATTRPYCLRCFAPLVRGKSLCGACGFVSAAASRRRYWNLVPSLRKLQRILRTAVVILILPSCVIFGRIGAWTVIFLACGTFYTLAKLTERVPQFRARLYWSVLFLLAALVTAWWALDEPAILPVSAGAFLLAAGTLVFSRWFDRWRDGLIEAGAERVPDPAALLAQRVADPRDAVELQRCYCLRCFATMPEPDGRCAACGYVTRTFERERYWNRSPGLVALANLLRAPFVVTPIAAAFGAYFEWLPRPMGALVFGVSLLLAFPAWWTIGHLVRRKPDLDLTAFWAILGLVLSGALIRVAPVPAFAALAIALVVMATGAALRRWKARLIAEGSVAVAEWEDE